MRRVRRVLAIDWSGDLRAGRRKIWLCEVAAGRVKRLENGRTREEIAERLIAEARRDPRFVVGLDFAFSFPMGFLKKRGHRTIRTVWAEARADGESWLAACPNPPFWGRPGKKKPGFGASLHRATERSVGRRFGRTPMSVFQIGGAGAVGVGSIRGMPVLERLRAAGFSIWPFERVGLDSESPLVVEIWPRIFMGGVVKSNARARVAWLEDRYPNLERGAREAARASDDAFDALVSALEMDRHRDELDRLAWPDDPVARLEGEIWRPGEPS